MKTKFEIDNAEMIENAVCEINSNVKPFLAFGFDRVCSEIQNNVDYHAGIISHETGEAE